MLHEDIRAVGIALGEFAGRVNPDDWRKLSALRDTLGTLANQAEWLENLRFAEAVCPVRGITDGDSIDTSMAEAAVALPEEAPQMEAKEDAAQQKASDKKSGKAAKEGA